MKLRRILGISFFLVFLVALCVVCFKNPIQGQFDCYIYEALVRGKQQPLETVYAIVKHSYARAEASSILDSPEHLAQLEPLYAIRPLYIEAVAVAAYTGIPYQHAISLVSVLSFFVIGTILLAWTGQPLYSALLLSAPGVVAVARLGTPDGLSACFVLASVWALTRNSMFPGLTLLLASVWVRTDNVIFVLLVLVWLACAKRISFSQFAVLALVAGASVLAINHFSGNYGWRVLFRYTFVGSSKNVGSVPPILNFREYLTGIIGGVQQIIHEESTLFALIGLAAWKLLPRSESLKPLLICVGVAAIARFLLFPAPDDRYFTWAYLIAGTILIQAVTSVGLTKPVPASST